MSKLPFARMAVVTTWDQVQAGDTILRDNGLFHWKLVKVTHVEPVPGDASTCRWVHFGREDKGDMFFLAGNEDLVAIVTDTGHETEKEET
jgi:hypothetical protein